MPNSRFIALCALLLGVCHGVMAAPQTSTSSNPALSASSSAKGGFIHSAAYAKRVLTQPSRRVAAALWRNDTLALAQFVHPKYGIKFSPYVWFDSRHTWTRSEIARAKHSKQVTFWGDHDAGEDSGIRLTWNEFRKQYISPRDFSHGAPMTFQSTRSRGTIGHNLHEVFPDADIVEFYDPGTKKMGNMDWKSLWLVWRTVGNKPYLVAVAGGRWTT